MRVGFIFIDAIALCKCLAMSVYSKIKNHPIIDWAIILAVDYLLFHTLLWETESWYSQAILPLLFLTVTFPTPFLKESTSFQGFHYHSKGIQAQWLRSFFKN